MQRRFLLPLALVIAATVNASALKVSADANQAFDRYATGVETRLDEQHRSADRFVQVSENDWGKLRRGELVVDRLASGAKVRDGLLHDWRGTLFVPGATAADFLALMQDGDHLSTSYAPQVERSRLLQRDGDRLQLEMRLHYRKVLTVVLDTRYEVRYETLDRDHGFSLSRSTQISEIAGAGSNNEHVVPTEDEHGFLWRLNTYWSYVQEPDGLLLQCEAISLSRDIPFGLEWAIGPFVTSIPRDSLEFTLNATRNALLSRRNHGH